MPDTPENQAAYPQPSSQAPGCGFPVLLLVVIFSLFTGALLQYAIGSLHSSEMALFRSLLEQLTSGDLLVADRYYGVFVVVRNVHHELRKLGQGLNVLARYDGKRKDSNLKAHMRH
mgnify:CR=1 FL=1